MPCCPVALPLFPSSTMNKPHKDFTGRVYFDSGSSATPTELRAHGIDPDSPYASSQLYMARQQASVHSGFSAGSTGRRKKHSLGSVLLILFITSAPFAAMYCGNYLKGRGWGWWSVAGLFVPCLAGYLVYLAAKWIGATHDDDENVALPSALLGIPVFFAFNWLLPSWLSTPSWSGTTAPYAPEALLGTPITDINVVAALGAWWFVYVGFKLSRLLR